MNPKEFFEQQGLNMHSTYVEKYNEWCCIVFGENLECWGFGESETSAWMDAYGKVRNNLGFNL